MSVGLGELKIEITRRCPLSCAHCSSWGSPHAIEQLQTHRVQELIAEFALLGGNRLCITGGEPLFYESLPLIVDTARKYGIQADVYTTGICPNGGHLTPMAKRTAASLREADVKLIFSLHGARPETHDTMTQVPGSFQATMAAIVNAIEVGARVEVHVVPTAINFSELGEIATLVVSLGITRLSWLRFVPQGRGRANAPLLALDREQVAQLIRTKAEIAHACPELEVRAGAPFNVLCPNVPAPCRAAIDELVICPDGRVVPCDAFKGFTLPDNFGSITEHPLPQVWQHSRFINQVRCLRNSEPVGECEACPLSQIMR